MMMISEKITGNLITIMISDSGNSIENTFKFYSDIFFVNEIMNLIAFKDGIDKFFKKSEERICKISLNNNYLESQLEKKFIPTVSSEELPKYYMVNEDISPVDEKHKWKIIINENENELEITKETLIPLPAERIAKEVEEKGFAVIKADGPTVISKYQLAFKGSSFTGKIQDCPKEHIEEVSNKAVELLEKSKKYLNLNPSTFVNIENLIEKNKNRITYSVESCENDNLFFEENKSVLEKSNMENFASESHKELEKLIKE